MSTRADHIQRALEEIGVAAYVFDLSGDELGSALRAHDQMLLQWQGEGIAFDYETPADGPALSDELVTPTWADEAISLNLAKKLAPQYGKTLNSETKRGARVGYDLCVARTMHIPAQKRAPVPIRSAGDRCHQPLVGPPVVTGPPVDGGNQPEWSETQW